jgi:hypothetical protein
MSSSSSSDGDYNNFQKYKKKHQMKKKRKAVPPKTSPKKFTSQFSALKNINDMKSSDESSEKEMTVEQLIEEQKKKKPEDIIALELDDSQTIDAEDVDKAGPSNRTRSQNSQDEKKKKNNAKPQFQRKAQALLDEMRSIEREQKMVEEAHQNAVEYIANKVEAPIITIDTEDCVKVMLGLMTDPEFRHIFKIKYDERFDKVFLDYGAKAGYDKPEDLTLIWDDDEEFKTIKYFDTPRKLKMPLNGTVVLTFNPKKGVQREKREEGEIKIKLNMKKQKNPLERLIHKVILYHFYALVNN